MLVTPSNLSIKKVSYSFQPFFFSTKKVDEWIRLDSVTGLYLALFQFQFNQEVYIFSGR